MKYTLICLAIILGVIVVIEAIYIIWLRKNIIEPNDIEEQIAFFRNLWGKFVFYVISTSIIGLFLCSIVFEREIELDIINNWVSIILGLVALVIGIISLFLSFYNLDQANKTQEKTVELIQDFNLNMVDRMNALQDAVEHKIEESSEKTREAINGRFNKTASNLTKTASIRGIWEENDE